MGTGEPRSRSSSPTTTCIVREGVRALLELEADIEVVGVAADFDELVAGAEAAEPQVVVTDIRMPPDVPAGGHRGGQARSASATPAPASSCCRQYDDPEYAVVAAGRGRRRLRLPAQGPGRPRATSWPRRSGRWRPAGRCSTRRSSRRSSARSATTAALGRRDEELLRAGGRGQADQGHRRHPADHARGGRRRRRGAVPRTSPRGASAGRERGAAAAADAPPGDRRPRGAGRDAVAGCSPAGWPRSCGDGGTAIGETERLVVTVLMSDIRGYSTIAEQTDPSAAGRPAQRAPGGDEPGDPRQRTAPSCSSSATPSWPSSAHRSRSPDHADRARGRRRGHARGPGRAQRAVGGRRASRRSGWASGSPPGRWRRRCWAARSGSSTRWSATR